MFPIPQIILETFMRIMPSILSAFGRRNSQVLSNNGKSRRDHMPSARSQDHSAFHPIGQSYIWGGPTTASNGFAPAIGYDAYNGGYGY
jgi:hypothetical protein